MRFMHILSSKFTHKIGTGHVFALANQICFRTHGFFVMFLGSFSALQFLLPALKVLAEIKTIIF